MADSLEARITRLAQWIAEATYPVFFTGAGISTESGLPDFRGPDGMWTRKARGLPVKQVDFSRADPNEAHYALVKLQNLGRLKFLISQNVDNLHLKSGINPELLAELHGNITKVRCVNCEFTIDHFEDMTACPLCGGHLAPSVVNFGQSLPQKDLSDAYYHSGQADLFVVVGSSLVVTPAADMPGVAHRAGARLVIINQGETPLDALADLRFAEAITEVLSPVVELVRQLLQ